jgi:hypothetical protein
MEAVVAQFKVLFRHLPGRKIKRLWWALAKSAFGGSLESGGLLCWCIWQESGFSSREDFFTLYFMNKEIIIRFILSKIIPQ